MKELEYDDPMEFQAVQADGDPAFMIDCVTEEYARLGWSSQQILELFQSLDYPFLYRMLQALGPTAIRARIERVIARCGVFRVSTLEAAPDPELELVHIAPLREGGTQDESGL